MRLPIGYDNFREVVQNGFDFVDKTLLIKDVIDDSAKVILITRPRRFGKTLNLSMLHYFFTAEAHGRPTQGLFDGLAITQVDQKYIQQQGQYPVVFLTFKDIKENNFQLAYEKLVELMINCYEQHHYLQDSPQLIATQKKRYQTFLNGEANRAQVEGALQFLTDCLFKHFGQQVVLLIDEYDTPIQSAYMHGYYEEMLGFTRSFLSAALKTNPSLHKAVMTGILRVSKESLFSDLNNITVYSTLNTRYSEYFGFTEVEVDKLLKQAKLEHKSVEIRAWYNGYQFGETTIYNPWSIVNCLVEQGKLQSYWINTSSNDLIRTLLIHSKASFKEDFEALMRGETLEQFIDERLVFRYLNNNEAAVWSLMLAAGYLKVVNRELHTEGLLCRLQIPNHEIHGMYRLIVEQWLSNGHGLKWYYEFLNALLIGDVLHFERELQVIYEQIISVHDMARYPEMFCHGLLLGLTASLHPTYEIKSNKESGLGFYDLMIIPKDTQKCGIIMEFKVAQPKDKLEKIAKKALAQIDVCRYDAELKQRGIQHIVKIGIAFRGKELKTLCLQNNF
jgi:hypothetical protein